MMTLNPQRYQVNNQTLRLFHYIFFAYRVVKKSVIERRKILPPSIR